MGAPDFAQLLDQYRAGLETEIALLRRLEDVARRQRQATGDDDLSRFNEASDDRDRLMAGLVSVEGEIRDVRRILSESREQARHLPGYAEAAALHQQAMTMAARILETDSASLQALAAAEQARRDAARAIEQGEVTLAAYRKVTARPSGAALVDRRG